MAAAASSTRAAFSVQTSGRKRPVASAKPAIDAGWHRPSACSLTANTVPEVPIETTTSPGRGAEPERGGRVVAGAGAEPRRRGAGEGIAVRRRPRPRHSAGPSTRGTAGRARRHGAAGRAGRSPAAADQ